MPGQTFLPFVIMGTFMGVAGLAREGIWRLKGTWAKRVEEKNNFLVRHPLIATHMDGSNAFVCVTANNNRRTRHVRSTCPSRSVTPTMLRYSLVYVTHRHRLSIARHTD